MSLSHFIWDLEISIKRLPVHSLGVIIFWYVNKKTEKAGLEEKNEAERKIDQRWRGGFRVPFRT